MGCDLPTRDGWMRPSLELLHSLGFLCFSAKEACVVPAACTHWVEQLPFCYFLHCLLAALPLQKDLDPKKSQRKWRQGRGKATLQEELLLARGQSWILPEKKVSECLCIQTRWGKTIFLNNYCLIGSKGATLGPRSSLKVVFKNKQANIKAKVFLNITFVNPMTSVT